MSTGSTRYARKAALRAVAAASVLAVNASAFVALAASAVMQYHELSTLRNALASMGTGSGSSQQSLAVLERTLEARRIASFGEDGGSRYRFASDINARLLRSGVTVQNVFPAREAVAGTAQQGRNTAFRYEVKAPPSALLAFLRAVRDDPVPIAVNPLRLRVESGLLRGELTVEYRGYESENP